MKKPTTMKEAIDRGNQEWLIYLEWTPSDQIKKKLADFVEPYVKALLDQSEES